jgi:hypothetical protein
MAAWTEEELQKIAIAKEIGIASRRADGTMRRFVTIWAVRVGGDIYVRSAYGPDNPWYRRAIASGDGRILAGGVERDVAFESADPSVHDDVDSAYHEKYDRHGARLVATVVGEHVHALTIRVVPKDVS